ncbi:MAG: ORF6N domain-containing protein [candidate division WOR-3 bacterium]
MENGIGQAPEGEKGLPSAPVRRIEQAILVIRGHRVMLSSDLAVLYGVPARRLNEQVRRNAERFPEDFMFQLTPGERRILKSQIATSSWGGARRAPPYAFTEQGVAMLSSVLRGKRAAQVNVEIMRTFVRLRRILAENAGLARRLDELEKKYNVQFKVVFDAIRGLMQPPEPKKGRIGFRPDGFGPDQTGPGSDFIARERAIATRQRRSRGEKRE